MTTQSAERLEARRSRQLVREPFRFDFFQAVRLIALAETDPSIRAPEPAMRTAQLPYEEHIRFRAHVGHAFPASAIFSFAQRRPTERSPMERLCRR